MLSNDNTIQACPLASRRTDINVHLYAQVIFKMSLPASEGMQMQGLEIYNHGKPP